MLTRYISSQFIKNIQKSKKRIAIKYINQSTAWKQFTDFSSTSIKEVFNDVIDKNFNSFKSEMIKIVIK